MLQAFRSPPDMLVLLRRVSRSFYVSIRLLPTQLRRPVAVAYLLARASDTLADTAELPCKERRDNLQALAAVIDGRFPGPATAADIAASFSRRQNDLDERALIAELPSCLRWLEELAPVDRDEVCVVMRHIIRGQALDLERFTPGTTRALDTPEQLHEYTYLVAGCVGEFWTELCFRHLPRFAALPKPEMRELGRDYGMGLQLTNILRDAGSDLAEGRCYFPAGEIAAAGLRPEDILAHPQRFETIWNRWHAQARLGLARGMKYADAVNSRRVRAASALPALIGARTLDLLLLAGSQRLQRRVKMPRGEVRWMMVRLAATLAGRAGLQQLYGRLQGAAFGHEWENPRP
jgi:farnesyl-diphosphate farnesyltransferase